MTSIRLGARLLVWRRFGLLLAGALLVLSCAHSQKAKVADMEQLLSAAGFHMRLADTPEKAAHLQSLKQHQITPFEKEGRIVYVYADAQDCRCLYTGDEQAYQKYQQLAEQQKIAQDQREAAQANEAAAMDWGVWGPWPLYP